MKTLSPAKKAFKKVKQKSISNVKRLADKTFSEYIRRRDDGQCFTCSAKRPWKQMQNGHYVSRMYNSLRFDEVNCNTQCPACNVFKHGNMDEYALKLKGRHGDGILESLNARKREVKQWKVHELYELIETYKTKTQKLT